MKMEDIILYFVLVVWLENNRSKYIVFKAISIALTFHFIISIIGKQ